MIPKQLGNRSKMREVDFAPSDPHRNAWPRPKSGECDRRPAPVTGARRHSRLRYRKRVYAKIVKMSAKGRKGPGPTATGPTRPSRSGFCSKECIKRAYRTTTSPKAKLALVSMKILT